MKVLMLGSGSIHSSLTHRLLSLGRELARRGHEVTIIVPGLDKYSEFKPDRPAEIDGVHVVYPYQFQTASPTLNLLPYLVASAFEVSRRRADVVCLYKPTPITIIGLLAKWLKRVPVVLDMDDLGSEVMAIEGQPAVTVRLVDACERLAAHGATAIVAASTFLEQEYGRRYPAKPLLRLSNGVVPEELAPQEADRPPRLIFFGALNRLSIARPLIEAMPLLANRYGHVELEAEILGEGACRAELEDLARRLGVDGQINFRGWTKLRDVARYAKAGDIGICMMPQERTTAACSNQKLFQYMALGLVPVVSDVGDLPLYAEHGQAGRIVAAGDAADLAATVHELLEQPATCHALAERGRYLAQTEYSWSHLAGRLEGLLASQTNHRPRV